MTDNNHLITPPLELVVKWLTEGQSQHHCTAVEHSINQAARWGANQGAIRCLKPSLREQALKALNQADKGLLNESEWQQCYDTIRLALEMLPNE